MDLKKLYAEKKTTLSGWFEFREGWELELEYADRSEIEKMLEKSKSRKWVRHQQTETYDDAAFVRQMAAKIKNWRGLTVKLLADLIPIDVTGMDPETEVECTPENAALLLTEAYGLAAWVRQMVMEVAAFRQEKQEAELKNLKNGRGKS